MKATRLAVTALMVVALMALAGPALAGRGSSEPPRVHHKVTHRTRVEPAVQRRSTLPFTGGDVASFVAAGLVAIGGGTLILRRARVRSA